MIERDNCDISDNFAEFWAKYPRKVARKYASDCWRRLTAEQRAAALKAIEFHARAWEAEGRQQSVIPHASSWLNGWRWEDEIEMPQERIPQAAVAWWASDEGVMSKGRELGVHARGGESMTQYKSRVVEAARKAA